ncbi:hypothetical protein CES85_5847 (plasmid) [Ochrobactrum quorumnocens]|uniref:Uncharacterized protein n=1 Tax=Ochrobactrum quorumnocens TaxID=271865 RepID=A0A248U917_9HYPH|nr:hypothetical protein CES85_5847 [[Ochrobactrum] quorumnocens]
MEYADSYRTVDMETEPLMAGQAVQLQSFIAAARGGAEPSGSPGLFTVVIEWRLENSEHR